MKKQQITTEEEALEAVKRNGLALKYVPDNLKTMKLCLKAVKQDEEALQFVPEELQEEVCRRLRKKR